VHLLLVTLIEVPGPPLAQAFFVSLQRGSFQLSACSPLSQSARHFEGAKQPRNPFGKHEAQMTKIRNKNRRKRGFAFFWLFEF
jgi:hypothetical protein